MKVRLRAWVEQTKGGMWIVKYNDGSYSSPHFTKSSAQKSADWTNNEDSDPIYFDDGRPTEEEEREIKRQRAKEAELWEFRKRLAYEKAERADKRREQEKKKIEDNRKSKRSNDKYVYVISLIERGKGGYTEYFKGETNLLKFKYFTTDKAEDAKVFNTKASAQKMVDTLTENRMVNALYRNLKVVQKKRELFTKS